MTFTHAARRRGFTLIELLIVIVVISILALIVIPRLMGAGKKAKEATLRANLHQIRTALEQFQSDTGVYPDSGEVLDVVAAAEDDVTTTIQAGTYHGPYLHRQGGIDNTGLPKNPFADATSTDVADHWDYTGDGMIVSAIDGTTADGENYTDF